MLLSSMHIHTRRPSRGESNRVKALLCHTAAQGEKSDRAGLGGERQREERGCGISHLFSLCLRASLRFRTLARVKR